MAVSKEIADKLAFVYTLACLKQNKNTNTYNMYATREIHAFRNKDIAELYHDTIEKIIEANAANKNYQALFTANEKIIDAFINDNQR